MAQVKCTTGGWHPATMPDPKTGQGKSEADCEEVARVANEKAKALGIEARYEVVK